MKIYYDTEFIDTGTTIDLVSIGMVAENGDELYAVSRDFDQAALLASPWLVDNVWPSLPKRTEPVGGCRCRHGHLDTEHPDVRPRTQIARAVESFVLNHSGAEGGLWAYFAAYDHVVLAQLWGPMVALPPGVPMWTNDVQQEAVRQGRSLPAQRAGLHNALIDARHVRVMAQHLGIEDTPLGGAS